MKVVVYTQSHVNVLKSLFHKILAFVFPTCTANPVLSSHFKIDKTKVLMKNGSLMQVKNIAECSKWPLMTCFTVLQQTYLTIIPQIYRLLDINIQKKN